MRTRTLFKFCTFAEPGELAGVEDPTAPAEARPGPGPAQLTAAHGARRQRKE